MPSAPGWEEGVVPLGRSRVGGGGGGVGVGGGSCPASAELAAKRKRVGDVALATLACHVPLSSSSSSSLEVATSAWEKCLDLKTGRLYYTNHKRNRGEEASFLLPLPSAREESNRIPSLSSYSSFPENRVNEESLDLGLRLGSDSEAGNSITERPDSALVTVGCSKCLMFVMLSQSDPRCPRCGSSAFLHLPKPSAISTL